MYRWFTCLSVSLVCVALCMPLTCCLYYLQLYSIVLYHGVLVLLSFALLPRVLWPYEPFGCIQCGNFLILYENAIWSLVDIARQHTYIYAQPYPVHVVLGAEDRASCIPGIHPTNCLYPHPEVFLLQSGTEQVL